MVLPVGSPSSPALAERRRSWLDAMESRTVDVGKQNAEGTKEDGFDEAGRRKSEGRRKKNKNKHEAQIDREFGRGCSDGRGKKSTRRRFDLCAFSFTLSRREAKSRVSPACLCFSGPHLCFAAAGSMTKKECSVALLFRWYSRRLKPDWLSTLSPPYPLGEFTEDAAVLLRRV